MLSSSASKVKTPSTSSSIASFDLDAVPVSGCSLMSESLSLDSLSTISDDSTPPIPPGCMVPLSRILGIGSSSTISEEGQMITTTIPTPPRLRTILRENLCIQRWSETIKNNCEVPGHTPWANLGNYKEIEWIPEGSIHPHDAFQAALAKVRGRRDAYSSSHRKPNAVLESQEDKKRTRRTTTHGSSYRKALVFEREITLDTGDEVKRWTLQVPALNMSPDMVDVMMELRRLNSFFKEEPDGLPPSLMISNSHSAMPLSLPSTASLQSSSGPTTLAVRRGNKPLPPLLTKSEVPGILEVHPYPEIPTAFRGTPTSTTPKLANFQNLHSSCKPSGDFTDMISTLRSQCATLQSRLSPRAAHCDELETRGESSEVGLVNDEDEWSFARPLLQRYGDQIPSLDSQLTPDIPVTGNAGTSTVPGTADTGKNKLFDRHACPRPLVVPSALTTIMPPFNGANDHPTTPTMRVSLGPLDTVSSMEKQRKIPSLLMESSHEIFRRTTPPPPRSPTPSGSMKSISPSNVISATSSPRGILKRCKSVRFAESSVGDGDDGVPTGRRSTPVRTRHSLGSGFQYQKPLKRSPLHATLTSGICTNQTHNTASLSASTPKPTEDATTSPTIPSLRTAGRQKPPSNYGKVVTKPPAKTCCPATPTRTSTAGVITIPLVTPTRQPTRTERSESQAVSAKGSLTPKPKPTNASPIKSRIEARKTIASSSLRSRSSTVSPGMTEKDKENKEVKPTKSRGRASLSALTYREQVTTESGFRRGSLGGSDTRASNSRMPVPLRKILTKFK
ncbi:hypothetical protein E1B28_007683 [Marasmius oreades]|uniref:Uncharacterized protein n=1 Tax=Marasmius oreades TaxID=181124 RepID=A0A9P7S3V6_9AGAR|nr:uncharacterized protein E1B28_007683 [Marasmius oreades]KAG7094063.1 hypothetical protein E1B28_007683 [Marasmius oreades]